MSDVAPFMADVRPIDRQECITATGIPLGVALREGLEDNLLADFIALPDGSPLVLWGVSPLKDVPGGGLIWLVATTEAEKYALPLHRVLSERLKAALKVAPALLWNVVWEKNELHVRWLRRVGAQFIAHHPSTGPLGEPFLEFIITKDTLTSLSGSGT